MTAGQTGITNLIRLIQALSGTGGQLGQTRDRTTTQDTTAPGGGFSQALGPISQLLGGVGGALGSVGQAALWDRLLNPKQGTT